MPDVRAIIDVVYSVEGAAMYDPRPVLTGTE